MRKAQQELPGVERKTIKEVENAADDYVDVRDRRMALTVKEVEKRSALVAVMKEHKITSYRYDERIITLVELDKVKVKAAKDDDGGNDEGD